MEPSLTRTVAVLRLNSPATYRIACYIFQAVNVLAVPNLAFSFTVYCNIPSSQKSELYYNHVSIIPIRHYRGIISRQAQLIQEP